MAKSTDKVKAKLPKGVAWFCPKHKTFADSFNITCAYCGYPKVKTKSIRSSK